MFRIWMKNETTKRSNDSAIDGDGQPHADGDGDEEVGAAGRVG